MSGMTKSERLQEMKRLYVQRAFTDIEMAERLGVERTTVYRDRIELTAEYPIEQDDAGRYHIDRVRLISEIKVNLHEALTLYLATRKSSRQTRFYQPHTASALEKLATALRQPMTERLLKTAENLLKQEKNSERVKILETITKAWVEQKKVRIRYQRLNSKDFINHVISPYLIEPSIWSDSVYVIALSDVTEKIIPFKVDRIQSAALSGETFEIPVNFDDQEMLKHAWGIWLGDKDPLTVKLRFSAAVTRRVKESIWHPLETVTDLEDGGCLWSADVAEWREMLPWVRGWGADVEVLEPKNLRDTLAREAQSLAQLYQVMEMNTKPYSVLWAKADKKDQSKVHRLVYHLIDVGQVALAMWKRAIDAESKRQFCQWLGCDEDAAGRTLAFLISLHDLGKASPSFQIKVKTMQAEIRKAGFWLPDSKPASTSPHGIVSAWALETLLPDALKISKQDAKKLARVLGGHHGAWPIPLQLRDLNATDKGNNEKIWDDARKELVEAMMALFNPSSEFSLPDESDPRELNAFLTLFSGFTSVADWIGSMTELFPYEKSVHIPLEEYAARAATNAEKALTDLGWLNWQADGKALTFKEMFPFIATPNSVQQTIMDEVSKTQLPALLILESPTGSGKTEAALYAADTWLQSKRGSGMYIAMPTQATSNQMHDRVTKFLRQRYPDELLNFHLVHGGALLEDKKPVAAQGISDYDDPNNTEGGIRAEAWFLPRKRTLLAPFGVGTVDQALMSVLQTRHFFVRMFGLQNKVVIFDEVHAYDIYMSELFKRLLAWLRQIGVSVVLLSATLPENTRRDLTAAYLGLKEVNLPPAAYPRLTIASASGVRSIPLETPSSRAVELRACDTQPQTIITHLRTALQNGGCAAVICNRVARAQELYQEIQAAGLVPEEDLILFHARFPFAWREEIEAKVLRRFGKDKNGDENPNRPQRSIVVATQVVEQSLDLDFDFMVSDLAPMDLLIQRAGRLHRHNQNDATRPENLNKPTLLIAFPQSENIPEFGHDEFVYDRSVMLKTWLALKSKTTMRLPEETTALIEAVYGGDVDIQDEALQNVLAAAVEKERQSAKSEIFKAKQQLIAAPEEEDFLSKNNQSLEEDDPTVHHAFRAATRNAEPGVTLICLHRVEDKVSLDPGGASPLELSHKPEKDVIRQLLRQSVHVQNRRAVDFFINRKPELSWKDWKEVAALKYAFPIVFENGRYSLTGTKYALILDRHTGLTILKEEQ